MNLHLFSIPGESSLQNIVAASKPYLKEHPRPIILYLPAAGSTLNLEYLNRTRVAFETLAEVEVLDMTQPVPYMEIESIIKQATVLYVPGGNTYLLLDRLYRSGAFHLIQERVQAGMAFVGFSAGMVICGKNILTSSDQNECGYTEFTGLGFTQYNFSAHYPASDGEERVQRDSRIHQYHNLHTNQVLALEDDEGIEIDNEGIKVVHGHCWLFDPSGEKVLLEKGYLG